MNPTAARGDLILSKSPVSLTLGDVVLFERSSTVVLHRLVERTEIGWRTKGDANEGRDPWILKSSAITGKAVGTLRGYGTPLLWLTAIKGRFAVSAKFASSHSSNALASAGFWRSPTMNWTVYANLSSMIRNSPSQVSISGSGERRIYSATRYSANTRIHFEGRVTSLDPAAPFYSFVVNGCGYTSDAVLCGWLVTVDSSTGKIRLQTIINNSARTGNLATCRLPSGFAVTSPHTISVNRIGNSLYVFANSQPCLAISDVVSLANSVGAKLPSGSYAGVMLSGSTAWAATKLVMW